MARRNKKEVREKLNFEQLVEAFRSSGYNVELRNDEHYDNSPLAILTGHGVRGMFQAYDSKVNTWQPVDEIANRIAVDNSKCFDKVSKCPLIMNLPVDFEDLMQHLKHLGSNEGYKISNGYLYLGNNPYPYEMKA